MTEPIRLTSFSCPELDCFARMNEKQLLGRDEHAVPMFIAESPKVIERALDAGYEPIKLLMEEKHVTGEAAGIVERCEGVPLYTAAPDILARITGFRLTRGALCAMKRKEVPGAGELLGGARRVAVLEDVMNPANVGAVIRSAAGLGFDCVLLTAGCADPLYRRAIRVSMGTVFRIPWTVLGPGFPWKEEGAAYLRSFGLSSAALALEDDCVSVDDPALKGEERLAVILGTEGDGLAPATVEGSDYVVKIPMRHSVDSLNVAAAAAVAFWELGGRG